MWYLYAYPRSTSSWTDALLAQARAGCPYALRDLVQHATDSTPAMLDTYYTVAIGTLSSSSENLKTILDVVSSRLALGWPMDYKALDLCAHLAPEALVPLLGKLETVAAARGPYAAAYQAAGEGLVGRVRAAKDRMEEEEARQRMLAVGWGMGGWIWPSTPVCVPGYVYPQWRPGWGWG